MIYCKIREAEPGQIRYLLESALKRFPLITKGDSRLAKVADGRIEMLNATGVICSILNGEALLIHRDYIVRLVELLELLPTPSESKPIPTASANDPPFRPGQRVKRIGAFETFEVLRCGRWTVNGSVRWVVDDPNGRRYFADDVEPVEVN